MRITIATGPCFPVPPLQGGAIPRLWQGLAEQFAACGNEVTVFCRAYPGQPAREGIRGVNYLRWGGYAQSTSIKRDLICDFLYALRAVWRLPTADIIVINDFFLPVFAGLFRRRAGLIVVNSARFPKGQMWIYRDTRRFAACSNVILDGITAENPSAGTRTRVLPNPVDTDVLRPANSPPGSGQLKTILYVGRVHPEKGVHVLIQAFGQLCALRSDLRLRIVGPHAEGQGGGGEEYLASLRSIAGAQPVEFTGPVFGFAQLAEIYRAADVFCYPSLAEQGEALPVAPLEAMAAGVVPVVSDLKCFRDFIVEGRCGVYFDHRTKAADNLARALEHLLKDLPRLRTLSAEAHRIAQQLSYANVARQYLEDFSTLLREAGHTVR